MWREKDSLLVRPVVVDSNREVKFIVLENPRRAGINAGARLRKDQHSDRDSPSAQLSTLHDRRGGMVSQHLVSRSHTLPPEVHSVVYPCTQMDVQQMTRSQL